MFILDLTRNTIKRDTVTDNVLFNSSNTFDKWKLLSQLSSILIFNEIESGSLRPLVN